MGLKGALPLLCKTIDGTERSHEISYGFNLSLLFDIILNFYEDMLRIEIERT